MGIVKKGNECYVELVPHEKTIRKEPELSGREYEVKLTEGDYKAFMEVLR